MAFAAVQDFQLEREAGVSQGAKPLFFHRVVFLVPPTGAFCREDRCQSFFDKALIPTMRVPLEETECAGAVREARATATIIDAPRLELTDAQVVERVTTCNPDLIILSITFGSLTNDLAFAHALRKRFPRVKIGLRGAPCYVWNKEMIADMPYIDLVLQGDYEIVCKELITQGIERAHGVTYRGQNGQVVVEPPQYEQNLDKLPRPDVSSIDMNAYSVRFLGAPQATIHVQRGCPFTCTYCLVHTVSGKVARHRSAQSIADEVNEYVKKGVTYFYLRADTLTLKRDWAIEVARAIAATCPSARWVSTTRVECIDAELLRELKAGGCYGLSFGIDVTTQFIAEKVKKPVSLEKAQRAMRLCDDAGILSLAYLMVGFVWETAHSLKETRFFARQLRPDLLTVHYAYPYPGTPYFDTVKEMGLAPVSYKSQAEPVIPLSNMSIQEIRRFGTSLLRWHYCRPRVLWSLLRKAIPLYLSKVMSR